MPRILIMQSSEYTNALNMPELECFEYAWISVE